jgi:hypothetical protein
MRAHASAESLFDEDETVTDPPPAFDVVDDACVSKPQQ